VVFFFFNLSNKYMASRKKLKRSKSVGAKPSPLSPLRPLRPLGPHVGPGRRETALRDSLARLGAAGAGGGGVPWGASLSREGARRAGLGGAGGDFAFRPTSPGSTFPHPEGYEPKGGRRRTKRRRRKTKRKTKRRRRHKRRTKRRRRRR